MPDFEGKRLEIYEEYIDDIEEKTDLSRGDYVFPSFTRTVSVDDGYHEADYILELTISNEREKEIVLMASGIYDDDRKILKDVEEEEPFTRARKYAAELEKGAYYGITDGKKVKISALDPDIKLEEVKKVDKLNEIINEIIKEERRIKRSKDFISKLNEYNENINPNVHSHLREKIEEDDSFEEEIRDFLTPIGKSYDEDENIPEETLEMLSRQATYLLVDKILFYHLILENEENLKEGLEEREKYDEIFEKLKKEPPKPDDDIEKWAKEFWGYLDKVFELIREINYEPIFDPEKSPLNRINLKEHPSACFEIKDLMDFLWKKEGLSNLFDGPLLAKIYEGLIPPELRWKWGQIYTPPEITRLIAEWAIRNPDDKILDPACGTGRFLISAYEKIAELKGVEMGENHQEIINQIQGIDINQFPAHLATMSLVAMSLKSVTENVNIKVKDFFKYVRGDQANLGVPENKVRTKKTSNSSDYFEKPIGKMDAIIMNPPYTRNEALSDDYKKYFRKKALSNLDENKEISMDKKAGYYAYFITHGTKFLKKDGRFGMIIQNSWLDADYGADIQEFILENYKIQAIVGTKKDRLIKTADVNTVILFLERENNKKLRNTNEIKFVQLKKDLEWFEHNYDFHELIEMIEENEGLFTEDIRILTKNQEALKEEGMGKTTYIGSKWAKYIRALDIYWYILDENSDILIDFNDLEVKGHGDLSYGTRSGAPEFFYLPNKHHDIEKKGDTLLLLKDEEVKFKLPKKAWMHQEDSKWRPNYIIKRSKGIEKLSFSIDDLELGNQLKYFVWLDKPKEKLDSESREYIEWGESHDVRECNHCNRAKKFPEYCSGDLWYDIGPSLTKGDILPNKDIHDKHAYWTPNENTWVHQSLYGITYQGEKYLLSGILNSTVCLFMLEIAGRINLGGGALDLMTDDHRSVKFPNPIKIDEEIQKNIIEKFKNIGDRKAKTIFEEIGADNLEEISLDNVKRDRRELDKIIMEDILGLSKREQLEVYRGLFELVKNRLEKPNSSD